MENPMSRQHSCFTLLLAALLFVCGSSQPHAQSTSAPTAEELIEALRSKTSRGVQATPTAEAPPASEADAVMAELKSKVSRGLSVNELDRSKVAAAARTKPKFDYEVGFDFGSDKLSVSALPYLTALGRAMQSAELRDGTFLVAGHTDAKGSSEYNQKLSERRAQSVVRYLNEHFGLRTDQLVAVGYGKEQLKLPDQPYADQNRRVEIVNITPTAVSEQRK